MRFQCSKIEHFIAGTLQLLFLTTFVECQFNGYQQRTTAMGDNTAAAAASDAEADAQDYLLLHTPTRSVALATTLTPSKATSADNSLAELLTAAAASSSASLSSSPSASLSSSPSSSSSSLSHGILLEAFLKLNSPSVAPTLAFVAAAPSASPASLYVVAVAAAAAADVQPSATPSPYLTYRDLSKSILTHPIDDILSDSNEIDIDDSAGDYVDARDVGDDNTTIFENFAGTAEKESNANMENSFSNDFSLLNLNNTAAASLTLSRSSGSGNNSNSYNNIGNIGRHSHSSSNNNMKYNNNSTTYNSNININININNNNYSTASTFLQIKSQKLNLKSTAAATTTPSQLNTDNNNNNNNNNDGDSSPSSSSSSSSNNKHNTKSSRDKVQSKLILSKPQKTDAPMLNYIFDTFSTANKHHHHDQRHGPHFEDVQRVGHPANITVQAGGSVFLNCRISLLQDKTVSWVRRNAQGEDALDLLTVGLHTYTGDKRYTMEFQYPSNWRLKITNVRKDDEAMYECQISTHPPRVIQINLHVNAPKVMIVDEFGDPLQEKYYEIDSTLQLSCIVRSVAMTSAAVFWKHGEQVLNYDITRGGVSVKTELMDDGANSTLFIAKISKSDSGNYTCSISDIQGYNIMVHILNGESFAELHHGGAAALLTSCYVTLALNVVLFIFILGLNADQMRR